VAIFFLKVPFPFVIIVAGLIGFVGSRTHPRVFEGAEHESEGDASLIGDVIGLREKATTGFHTLRVFLVGMLIWWGPLLLLMAIRGTDDTLSKEALFFSQAAMVTFGGAYAVLAYINQAAVQHFGWLLPGQMVTGLGLAESTPGPLILVTEFVGFLGAYRLHGSLDPVVAGILGAMVTTWATFAPCFLWIFLGAPYIERLRGNRSLNGALTGITAAVVGVILNLAVTFAIVALFDQVEVGHLLGVTFPRPDLASIDVFALALATVGFVLLWRYRWNVLFVVMGSAAAGLLYKAIF
jgi:chromate transporter